MVRELGRGAMGVVWLAHDQVLERPVSIKQLHTLGGGHVASMRFVREARLAGRLSNPAIVTVYDVFHHDGVSYVVMELLDGTNLADHVEQLGPLPMHRVAQIGLDLLSALTAAHSAGIVHRDVKPANVVLTPASAKLTDFGIAHSADDTRLTGTGLLIGSPAYMAPERLNGDDASAASDLWALGATLFYASEGRPAFQRANLEATMAAVLTEKPVLENTRGPLAEVITGLLAPAKNRLDAESVRPLLEHARDGDTGQRRRTPLLRIATITAVAVIVIAVAILWPSGDDQQTAAPDRTTPPASATKPSTSPTIQPSCPIDRIEISGSARQRPSITIPRDCAPPTALAVHDITTGRRGKPVPEHNDDHLQLNIRTEALSWSGKPVWSTWNLQTAPQVLLGHRADDGLAGMRPGGRRTIVVPPHHPYWSTLRNSPPDTSAWPADDTVVLVVDLIS
ncbi:protein kinase domain-containing protein [Amycolatopsis regifaucium]|uniref:protein kinase domain-containing protein n=1 Tax=Amycolatopsis regifaucium TaxID=546365 RepID=UPI001300D7C4|nr:protein kinase [Amycolatopsis regifaucium]